MCHGDDADSHRRRSFCTVTIGSPLMPARSTWENRVMIYIIDTSRAVTETYDVLDSWVVYGLCELQEGRFFDVDLYGAPCQRPKAGQHICGQFRGVLVALKGDQKYLQRNLKLTTSWNSERVCMYCAATSHGALMYTAFGPNAPHRGTLVNNEYFMANGCRPGPWIRLPGFDLELVLADWLHLVDLSLTPEVCASDALQ